ncbi:MAG: SRPBCC domain-containing protein [Polyangiaceae bacterium]|nr:SRPBCC domain-containing protein [Polyangiaceae bacterium]
MWEAMFTPDRMRRWMLPPPGWTMTTCSCVMRVGGALEVAWKSDEADPAMTLRGVFTEVSPHEQGRSHRDHGARIGPADRLARGEARVLRRRRFHHHAHHANLRLQGSPRRRPRVRHG